MESKESPTQRCHRIRQEKLRRKALGNKIRGETKLERRIRRLGVK